MNLATILDDCLQRLQAGETIAGCLARYPDQAADLAPMLAAAAQRGVLFMNLKSGGGKAERAARVEAEEQLARVATRRADHAGLDQARRQPEVAGAGQPLADGGAPGELHHDQ